MICIIPAAGQSSRFVAKGYEEKPLLPMNDGRTMIQWVYDSLPQRGRCVEVFILVPRKGAVTDYVYRTYAHTGGVYVECVDQADGPLATISNLYAEISARDDELWINYVDTFLWPYANAHLHKIPGDVSTCMITFESENPRYGRTPNGSHACGGMAYFRKASEFVEHAMKCKHGQEGYGGQGIPQVVFSYERWHNLNLVLDHDLIDLGVPEAYELFLYGNK